MNTMMANEQRKPVARSYADLTLELRDLDPGRERYVVGLSGSSVGEIIPAAVDLRYSAIEDGLQELEDGGIDDEDDRIALGRALADRLLPEGDVRTAVTEAIRAAGTDEGVRLRLVIREPRLAQIPWEFTYLSLLGRERMSDFLVLDPKVSLVRHEALPLPRGSATARDPDRLRLVAATANAPGFPELDLRREWRVVERAIRDLPADGATVDYQPVLENPSIADLQGAVLRGADLFHFAGHGGLEHGIGYLALPPDEAGAVERLPADRLAGMLRQAGVRVAVLGACESGRRDGNSPWDGVATALVGAQVAAVVAMQYRIRDSSAIKFARGLYTALAVGLSIDEAVAAGRLAVYDPDDLSSSWGIPVLYSRSPGGVIFPHLSERDSASADALRTSVRTVVERIATGGRVVGIGVARGASGSIDVSMKADVVEGEMIGINELQIGVRDPRRPDEGG
jgi:hypothetical protein